MFYIAGAIALAAAFMQGHVAITSVPLIAGALSAFLCAAIADAVDSISHNVRRMADALDPQPTSGEG